MMWLEMKTIRGRNVSINPSAVAAVLDISPPASRAHLTGGNGDHTKLFFSGGAELPVQGKCSIIAKAVQNELGHRSRKL